MAENPMQGTDPRDGARPGVRSFAITPNDGVDLPVATRWIYNGGAGHIVLTCVDDNAAHTGVTLTTVPAGSLLRIAARRIYATGTTATGLVGFA